MRVSGNGGEPPGMQPMIYLPCAQYVLSDIPLIMNYTKAKELFELYLIITALNRQGWKVPRAAADLGITKQGVFRVIKKYKLKPGSRPPSPASFLVSTGIKLKPVRRVVLFDPLDLAWLKSKEHLGSYSQLIRVGLKVLKKAPEARIRKLL